MGHKQAARPWKEERFFREAHAVQWTATAVEEVITSSTARLQAPLPQGITKLPGPNG